MVELRTVQDVMDEIVAAERVVKQLNELIDDGSLHEYIHEDAEYACDKAVDIINTYIDILAEFEIKRK